MDALIQTARYKYHERLLEEGILTVDSSGIPSNADRDSKLSIAVAKGIADSLQAKVGLKAEGQTSGAKFETVNMQFIEETFLKLSHLRPGKWHVAKLGNRNSIKTSSFSQYEHLDYLSSLTKSDPRLAASLGNDYMVAPDVVVYRDPEEDEVINSGLQVVEDIFATRTDIRKRFNPLPILHASISAKWTIRSDRAQNSRTEALGLIRNRKGHLPHIMVVTAEPLPSRIASLAMGTGDIDCVYHFALNELIETIEEIGAEDAQEMIKILVEGKRLKDISDLPLDLTV